ncbi:MAG: hypothetical protein KDC98_21815 [Planctomycetes bacterium]|nr:hypothetical protein [Planctomycetota bacterium]
MPKLPAVLVLALLPLAAAVRAQGACSTFDTGPEGWTSTPGGGNQTWRTTGGNGGGFLEFEDLVSGPYTAFAPAAFLGDLSAFDGGEVAVDLVLIASASGTQRSEFGQLTIQGPAGLATADLVPGLPPMSWSHYVLSFDAAAFGVSQALWTSILQNVTSVSMDVDSYNSFGDKVGLDNFCLCPPASCTFRNGSGINPAHFFCTGMPVLGTNWNSAIITSPQTTATAVGITFAAAQLPMFGGEILIALTPPPVLMFGLGTHTFAVPNVPGACGLAVTSQGFRLDTVGGASQLTLLNALDLVFGP